jgi:hypothetical protein
MGYGKINAYKAVKYAFSLQTNLFFDVGGVDQGGSENLKWILNGGGCTGLSAASYIAKRHEIRKTVSYPYTQAPIIVGCANGLSYANPNNGTFYMAIESVSSTSATVKTYVYEIISGGSGWVPCTPSEIRFDFTILSSMENNIFLQNQTISTGTEVHNAMNNIEVGNNVTNSVPTGDFVVNGDANITLHAGTTGILKPGTIIQPGTNGLFRLYADPFFTCSQYPNDNSISSNLYFPPVIKDYEVNKLELKIDELSEDNNSFYFKCYPNPIKDNTTIKYSINKSEKVTLTISNNQGRQLYFLKNKSIHEAGTYQVKLLGINLPAGIYYCTLQTESIREIIKLIVVE